MRPKDESEKKGGRKKASIASPNLEKNLRQVVDDHKAGDPLREEVVWTYLSSTEIAKRLDRMGTPVAPDTVRGLLSQFGFRKRKAEKSKVMGEAPFRNEQFENIAHLKQEYFDSSNPMISMDTKKKELLGEFFRAGESWANGVNATFDHDFPSYADGKIIPHGLYDIKRNVGHITLGTSHDTSLFACDSFYLWWQRHGTRAYPKAKSILLLCDGGGSNNWRHNIFKEDLQQLVALSTTLLEIQSNRTPLISSCHACLVRHHLPNSRYRHEVPSSRFHKHRSESYLRCPGEGVPPQTSGQQSIP